MTREIRLYDTLHWKIAVTEKNNSGTGVMLEKSNDKWQELFVPYSVRSNCA